MHHTSRRLVLPLLAFACAFGGCASSTPPGASAGAAPHRTEAPDPSPAPAPRETDLDRLARFMSGTFSSRRQAESDPDFLDVRLFVAPVWPEQPDRWLYVEQARPDSLDKPYRQRIYRLSALPDGTLRSDVFVLPGEAIAYAGAWRAPSRLSGLSPQTLTLRDGCSIGLRPDGPDAFVGSTIGTDCPSELKGASYATSEVRITDRGMTSWDRGFNASGKQVWGSEKSGYEFVRDEHAADAASAAGG